jgi:hypothetical protein
MATSVYFSSMAHMTYLTSPATSYLPSLLACCLLLLAAFSLIGVLLGIDLRDMLSRFGILRKKLTSNRSTRGMTSEERAARDAMERLKELTKPSDRPKGYARLFGTFMSLLIVSWAGTGWLAVHDHRQIKAQDSQIIALRSQLAAAVHPPTNIHTWFDVQVVGKQDRTHYMVHVRGRQKREAFFLCEDSNQDADWDIGMELDSVTFEMRDGCKSIHDDVLGFYVHRDPGTTRFIKFAKEYD